MTEMTLLFEKTNSCVNVTFLGFADQIRIEMYLKLEPFSFFYTEKNSSEVRENFVVRKAAAEVTKDRMRGSQRRSMKFG